MSGFVYNDKRESTKSGLLWKLLYLRVRNAKEAEKYNQSLDILKRVKALANIADRVTGQTVTGPSMKAVGNGESTKTSTGLRETIASTGANTATAIQKRPPLVNAPPVTSRYSCGAVVKTNTRYQWTKPYTRNLTWKRADGQRKRE